MLERETLLTIDVAAKMLGVSKRTLRRWEARGELEVLRKGRKAWTSREAINRCLQPSRVKDTSAEKILREFGI